ncbi:unnamed protein product [Schistocephalus solidus]|uniref:Uncharacterized protein n=1 Tax=Schistocephalus solidus TaxID=70667 RepID=A0A183TFA0_SCHSO|nr:unnamed protein product [Schistocephalus solidus]
MVWPQEHRDVFAAEAVVLLNTSKKMAASGDDVRLPPAPLASGLVLLFTRARIIYLRQSKSSETRQTHLSCRIIFPRGCKQGNLPAVGQVTTRGEQLSHISGIRFHANVASSQIPTTACFGSPHRLLGARQKRERHIGGVFSDAHTDPRASICSQDAERTSMYATGARKHTAVNEDTSGRKEATLCRVL